MTSRFRTLIQLLVFGLAGCAPALQLDSQGAAAPYSLGTGGRILVEATLNGTGPYLFALDSGASISTIFDPVVDALQLQPLPGKEVVIHGLVSSGRFPLFQLDSLELGRAKWSKPRIAAIPGDTEATREIDGLLGIDFLKRYAVGFRAGKNVLYLYPPEMVSAKTYPGWTSIPLEAMYFSDSGAALYYFSIRMGKYSLPALFDLGAGENVVNWPAVQLLDLRQVRGEPVPLLSGALESTMVAARFRANSVTTGRVRWHDEEFLAADLSIFRALGQEQNPFVILGAGLFNQRDFIIDFTRNRLLVRVSMAEFPSEKHP